MKRSLIWKPPPHFGISTSTPPFPLLITAGKVAICCCYLTYRTLAALGRLTLCPTPCVDKRIPGWVTGYVRRFWQVSTYKRYESVTTACPPSHFLLFSTNLTPHRLTYSPQSRCCCWVSDLVQHLGRCACFIMPLSPFVPRLPSTVSRASCPASFADYACFSPSRQPPP